MHAQKTSLIHATTLEALMFQDATIIRILDKFHKIFTPENADVLARSTGFLKRRSNKLQPLQFLILMVVKLLQPTVQTLGSMTNYLSSMKGATNITPQALSQRL